MMEKYISQQNYHIGCRVCRQILFNTIYISFQDHLPDMDGLTYSDAFAECTNLEIEQNDELPRRLCSDCAHNLTVCYQFRKQAADSDGIFKKYIDLEKKEENEMYENAKCQDEEMVELELLEEIERNENQKKELCEEEITENRHDAVSFLTDILKKQPISSSKKQIEEKNIQDNSAESESDDRKHVCSACNKKFKKRSNLVDHLRLHANVKIFSCDFCEKSFVQVGNFRAHLRTHTKEKPFQCNVCNKKYSQSGTLKIHMRTHTQEKNYLCDTCDRAFTNSSDLGKHKMVHDPVKKFRCEECQRPFTQKIHLKKHVEKHHPVKVEKVEKSDAKIIFTERLEEIIDGDKV